MGRVRSGQPEGKLIPRRSDGNAFLARPPPPPPPPPPPGSRFSPLFLSLSLSLCRFSRLQPLPSPCHALNLSPSLPLSLSLSLFLSFSLSVYRSSRQQPLSSPCRASNFSLSRSRRSHRSRRKSRGKRRRTSRDLLAIPGGWILGDSRRSLGYQAHGDRNFRPVMRHS